MSSTFCFRNVALLAIALATQFAPSAAWAGPRFMTDDPEPTETGQWEIVGPIAEISGRGSTSEASLGVEINYGAAPDFQVTRWATNRIFALRRRLECRCG